jgi:ABC-type transport system involved in multi-copper enzyme maturation permease subunit
MTRTASASIVIILIIIIIVVVVVVVAGGGAAVVSATATATTTAGAAAVVVIVIVIAGAAVVLVVAVVAVIVGAVAGVARVPCPRDIVRAFERGITCNLHMYKFQLKMRSTFSSKYANRSSCFGIISPPCQPFLNSQLPITWKMRRIKGFVNNGKTN